MTRVGRDSNASYNQKYEEYVFAVLLIKSCALMIDLANQLFFKEEKMQSMSSLKEFLMGIVNANGW